MKHFCRRMWYFAPLIILAFAGFIYITMLLWNGLLPVLFHLPPITFWQAAGLMILTRLLFSGVRHHKDWHHNHMREKWMNMTSEERSKFREHLKFHRRPWTEGCCDDNKQTSAGNPQA